MKARSRGGSKGRVASSHEGGESLLPILYM